MHYMSMALQWLLDQLQGGSCLRINLLTALQFVFTACEGVTSNTMRNCWGTTKIMSGSIMVAIKNDNDPTALPNLLELESLVMKMRLCDPVRAVSFVNESYEEVESINPKEMQDIDGVDDEDGNGPLSHCDALRCSFVNQLKTYVMM